MGTVLVVAFLAVHGFVHAAIWLPHPEPDPDRPPPFAPDHSALLTVAAVPRTAVHGIAAVLATAAAVAYLVAAAGVAVGTGWVVPVAVVAALLGVTLKLVYFNPWLTLGVLLDVLVLGAALFEWPVALS